jgi:DNA-binding transcriptional LysR family regulator
MNIQQMKYVVAIANNGSFREAAKKLYVAQPSLSHAVKELEEELSTQLFERTNKGAYLTGEGEEFVEMAQKLLGQFEQIENRYTDTEKKKEHFSISSQHYDFLAIIISQLMKEELEYKSFRIFESTTQKVIEDVASFRSELGIIFLDDQNSTAILRLLEHENIGFESIASFKTHIFLGKDHPLANNEEITVEELRKYPQVRFTQEANTYSYFSEDLIDIAKTDRVIHTSDRATLTGILQNTNAYGTGSAFVENREQSGIKLVPLQGSPEHRISILHPKNKPFTPIALRFTELLKNYLNTKEELHF